MLKKGKKATAKKMANNFVKFAMMVTSVPWQLCMSCCHASPLLPLTNFYNKKVLRRIPLNVRAISAKSIYQKTTHSTVTF